MKKQSAISNLRVQKTKLSSLNYLEKDAWKAITSACIKSIFGEKSEEYRFIQGFVFYRQIFIGATPAEHQQWTNEAKPELNHFIDGCIENISINGLPPKEWNHLLTRIRPELLWAIFLSSLGFAFFLGGLNAKRNSSNEAPQEKAANKSDSSDQNRNFMPDTTERNYNFKKVTPPK